MYVRSFSCQKSVHISSFALSGLHFHSVITLIQVDFDLYGGSFPDMTIYNKNINHTWCLKYFHITKNHLLLISHSILMFDEVVIKV